MCFLQQAASVKGFRVTLILHIHVYESTNANLTPAPENAGEYILPTNGFWSMSLLPLGLCTRSASFYTHPYLSTVGSQSQQDKQAGTLHIGGYIVHIHFKTRDLSCSLLQNSSNARATDSPIGFPSHCKPKTTSHNTGRCMNREQKEQIHR